MKFPRGVPHDLMRCTAIKPWEFVADRVPPSAEDWRVAQHLAAQILRCTLPTGHAGSHAIAPRRVGEVAAVWNDEPPVWFTTNPSKIYT